MVLPDLLAVCCLSTDLQPEQRKEALFGLTKEPEFRLAHPREVRGKEVLLEGCRAVILQVLRCPFLPL